MTMAAPESMRESSGLGDQVVRMLEFRHAVAFDGFDGRGDGVIAPHHEMLAYTPPREVVSFAPLPRKGHDDHSVSDAHHALAKRQAMRIVFLSSVFIAAMLALAAILVSVAMLVFGDPPPVVCPAVPIPHGAVLAGSNYTRLQATCADGYEIAAWAQDIRCRLVSERCYVAQAATASKEVKESCVRTFAYTTARVAAESLQGGGSEDHHASVAALSHVERTCVPSRLPTPTQLYERGDGLHQAGLRLKAPRRRASAPAAGPVALVLLPLGALVASSVVRAQRPGRGPPGEAGRVPSAADEDSSEDCAYRQESG